MILIRGSYQYSDFVDKVDIVTNYCVPTLYQVLISLSTRSVMEMFSIFVSVEQRGG